MVKSSLSDKFFSRSLIFVLSAVNSFLQPFDLLLVMLIRLITLKASHLIQAQVCVVLISKYISICCVIFTNIFI